jgi:hypothetical protein
MLPAAKREQGFETGATGLELPPVPVWIGTARALICASMRKHATHVNQSNIRRFTEDSPFRGHLLKNGLSSAKDFAAS